MALVIATKRGYYKKIREPGDKFEYPLKKDDPMPSWMERVGKLAADKAKEASDAAEEAAKEAERAQAKAELDAEAAQKKAADAAEAAQGAEQEADDELDLDLNGSDESTEGGNEPLD